MKRIFFQVYGLLIVSVLLGCNNVINESSSTSNDFSNRFEITSKIQELKNNGLLDEAILASRNMENTESVWIEKFINNTDQIIDELLLTENGKKEVKVIETLFTGGSPADFSSTMNEICENVDINFMDFFKNKNRCVTVNDVIIDYYSPNNSREIFAHNMNWDTIAWYSGFCAATTAGFIAATYGTFWVRIAGYVAATAGTASMCTQLYMWLEDDYINDWVGALINQNNERLTELANSDAGRQLLTISSVTAVPYVAGYMCPTVKFYAELIKTTWNDFTVFILAHIPSWLVISRDSIGIKLTL